MQSMKCQPLASGREVSIVGKIRKSPWSDALSIDVAEAPERRIERLITENPVVIFSRGSCCMCHVMRRLFATVGVHPTVIQLEESEEAAAAASAAGLPAVFIGGYSVGGLEGLMGLHLSGRLIPRLREVGALCG